MSANRPPSRTSAVADTEIARYAREVIAQESAALSRLLESVNESFIAAARLILGIAPGGRVVTGGVGKAGFIAMKVSATLASGGVSSFFLHPAEAIHGDLGRFTRDDIALVFSNTGETLEITRLMPYVKNIGCGIIAVTGNPTSRLGRESDLVISYGKIVEAGPLALAPTTSTAVMLALGDALAMSVLQARGFDRETFASFHPGGSLGHLLLPVSEVMRKGERVCIVRDTQLSKEVLHQITVTPGRPGAAAVVGLDGKLSGVFTDGDLRRCLDARPNFLELPISEVMGKAPKTVRTDTMVQDALNIMSQHQIDQLIVVNQDNVPLGLVDIQDVITPRMG